MLLFQLLRDCRCCLLDQVLISDQLLKVQCKHNGFLYRSLLQWKFFYLVSEHLICADCMSVLISLIPTMQYNSTHALEIMYYGFKEGEQQFQNIPEFWKFADVSFVTLDVEANHFANF